MAFRRPRSDEDFVIPAKERQIPARVALGRNDGVPAPNDVHSGIKCRQCGGNLLLLSLLVLFVLRSTEFLLEIVLVLLFQLRIRWRAIEVT